MPTDLPEQGLVVLGLEHGEHPEQAAHHHRCGHRRHPALELDHEVVQAGLGRAIAEGARRVERASQLTGAQGEYGFADTDLPEGEELSLNPLQLFFQWVTNHKKSSECCLENPEPAAAVSIARGRCAAGKTIFDPDLE